MLLIKIGDIKSKTLRQTTRKKLLSKERKHTIFKCYKDLIA